MLRLLRDKAISILELPVRVLGPVSASRIEAFEAEHREQFSLSRPRIIRRKGVSALIRAKDEEKNIEIAIRSIVDVFDEIIVVDNGSSDKTSAIVEKLRKQWPHISLYSYPFTLKKCGKENTSVPANSVHSITHLSNWSLSKCNYAYIMKWDADMVLSSKSDVYLKKLLAQLSSYWPTFVSTQQQTIYVKNEQYYCSIDEINSEIVLFPNRADVRFERSDFFELLTAKVYRAFTTKVQDLTIFEVKRIDEDEFAHWDTEDFPTMRKKREFERFHQLKNNDLRNFQLFDDPALVSTEQQTVENI